MSCIQHCIFNYGVDITSQYCWYCQFVLCMHAPRNRHAPLSIRKLRAQVVDHATVLFVASLLGFWGDFTGFKRFRGFWDLKIFSGYGDGSKPIITMTAGITMQLDLGYHPGTRLLTHRHILKICSRYCDFNLPVISNDLPIFLDG